MKTWAHIPSLAMHVLAFVWSVSCPQLEVVEVGLISLVPLGRPACPTQGPLPWEGLRGDWHGPSVPPEEASRVRVPLLFSFLFFFFLVLLLLMPELGGGSGHAEGRKWRPAGRPVV